VRSSVFCYKSFQYKKLFFLFKSFIVIVLLTHSFWLHASEIFRFKIGDEIWIQADKSYTQGVHKDYFAVGNVVINHQNETLYGESASVDRESGEMRIWGNVRYVAKDITLYGSELRYNLYSGQFDFENARIISSGYTIVGKHITRSADGTYLASDAEYSTCKDCPESWALMGSKIALTKSKYVHIQHAFIKSHGAILLYIPFISIPVKKERETGLLFPNFHYQPNMGMIFQQPWFWAISPSNDLTLTPSIWGRRGLGGELEYRHVLGEEKWFQLNTMGVNDHVYTPNRNEGSTSGTQYNRVFGTYEYHFQFGNYLIHHLHYTGTRDLDVARDFHDYVKTKAVGSDLGESSFVEYRHSIFDANIQSYFSRNMLVNDAMRFDHSYVQILPKFSLEMVPISLIHTKYFGMQNLALGAFSTYTVFKQNHFDESFGKRRNALRTTLNPYLDWNLGSLGPLNLKSLVEVDYQHYHFRKPDQSNFSKRGTVFTTELNFEIQKIVGMAFQEKIPVSQLTPEGIKAAELAASKNKEEKKIEEENILGELPKFETQYTDDYLVSAQSGYRHSQVFKLLHYYTSNQSFKGNPDFRNQITSQKDLFDYEDVIRMDENSLGYNVSRTVVSTKNSIEFQWNNSLIRKSPFDFNIYQDERILLDNFDYSKVAYFNLSQALRLNTKQERKGDNMERLHLETGFSLGKWTFSGDEFFFYHSTQHKSTHQLVTSIGRSFQRGNASLRYEYNGFSTPRRRYLTLESVLRPFDTWEFQLLYREDMERRKGLNSRYAVIYRPTNNCWSLELSYLQTALQKRFSFNFYFNFGDNKFNGV